MMQVPSMLIFHHVMSPPPPALAVLVRYNQAHKYLQYDTKRFQ